MGTDQTDLSILPSTFTHSTASLRNQHHQISAHPADDKTSTSEDDEKLDKTSDSVTTTVRTEASAEDGSEKGMSKLSLRTKAWHAAFVRELQECDG